MNKKCSNKNCSKKGEKQPPANFYPNPRASDGLRSYCKICDNERTMKYYNRDKANENSFYDMWIG